MCGLLPAHVGTQWRLASFRVALKTSHRPSTTSDSIRQYYYTMWRECVVRERLLGCITMPHVWNTMPTQVLKFHSFTSLQMPVCHELDFASGSTRCYTKWPVFTLLLDDLIWTGQIEPSTCIQVTYHFLSTWGAVMALKNNKKQETNKQTNLNNITFVYLILSRSLLLQYQSMGLTMLVKWY